MDTNSLFFLQIAVMLSVGLLGGYCARKLGFPTVIGELVAGVALGPTLFGAASPSAAAWMFPNIAALNSGRDALVRLAILAFLFAAGMEVDLSLVRSQVRRIAWTSSMGILGPFALGVVAVFAMPGLWGRQAAANLPVFALFLGTALSISALPVTARILLELGLLKQRIGMVIMASAVLNDLVGWTLFALLLDHLTSVSATTLGILGKVGIVLALFVLFLTVGRRAIQFLLERLRERNRAQVPLEIGLGMTLMLGTAALVGGLGVHPIFGAFLAGIAFGRPTDRHVPAQEAVSGVAMGFLAPLYFVSVGMKTNFITQFHLPLALVVFLIACVGKVGGAFVGARLGKMSIREAAAVGFGMNARGAMEIVLASVALEHHLIDEALFVALVTMAMATSAISGPMLRRLLLGYAHEPILSRQKDFIEDAAKT